MFVAALQQNLFVFPFPKLNRQCPQMETGCLTDVPSSHSQNYTDCVSRSQKNSFFLYLTPSGVIKISHIPSNTSCWDLPDVPLIMESLL